MPGTRAGPPVICQAHVQGLDRGAAQCTSKSAAANSKRLREQRKAESGALPLVIPPIPELDTKRLISSKVASSCLSLCLQQHCVLSLQQCNGPPRRQHHPAKTTRRQMLHFIMTPFQCSRLIQLSSYCMLSPLEGTGTTSRLSL